MVVLGLNLYWDFCWDNKWLVGRCKEESMNGHSLDVVESYENIWGIFSVEGK